VLCDLGDAYLALDDYSQSVVYYEQAASIAEQVGDLYVRAIALRGMGDARRISDRPDEALYCYQLALRIVQEIEEPYQHAVILDCMAEIMLRVSKEAHVGDDRPDGPQLRAPRW
jgi:tetratricopeptide (TPR) repeat protein